MQSLGNNAQKVIQAYLALPVGAKPSCPYFNNRRKKIRGGLRVLKGKGTPHEIVEECLILAKLARVSIDLLSKDELKEFIIHSNLGVDCSGFAYHVLDAHAKETCNKKIASHIKSLRTGIIGNIIARLRPAENIGVSSFRHDKNSHEIHVEDAQAGDIITCIGTGKEKTYNHILVITEVQKNQNKILIAYAHSYAWPSDGISKHGVREGSILVAGNNILQGVWTEQNEPNETNYTFESMRTAKEVSVRRLNFLS